MPEIFDISQILSPEYRKQAVIVYNRMEPLPRTANFERSLKAEIRDPLWMLTRQWQFGEFAGEDAASVFTARIAAEHTIMDRVEFPGNVVFPLDEKLLLEPTVEREKIRAGLFMAVQMGRVFLKFIRNEGLFNVGDFEKFLEKYRIDYPTNDNDYLGIELLEATKEKLIDGFLLYTDIITPDGTGTKFQTWLTDESLPDTYLPVAEKFRKWYLRNYSDPSDNQCAWLPSQLEYKFSISSPVDEGEQKTLDVKQYSEGQLDWYSFDLNLQHRIVDPQPVNETDREIITSFIPTTVFFKGMPKPRYWMMEESQTDFGKIDTSATGLLHLLLAEFGLIYSNDWFMLPYPLTTNTLCEVKNIVVTDVFGEHILIRPAGKGSESTWQRWAMFHHTDLNNAQRNSNLFYLAPSVYKSLNGDPLEQINFLRDEMVNMVWAVEKIVPSQAGKGVRADEMTLKDKETPRPLGLAPIRYVLGTTVPENWIPFIPVHIDGNTREIRLQRASMPGATGGLGNIVKEKPAPYYINEEEVPRSGIIVKQYFRRARGISGKSILWLAREKKVGRGEGWSNLKFDQIENVDKITP
jgi:hypothetical protein